MPFLAGIRPLGGDRRLLFEELEARVVLDASVDDSPDGSDTLMYGEYACPCSMQPPYGSASTEVATLSAQRSANQAGASFFGRQDIDHRSNLFWGRHSDDLPLLGDAANHDRVVKVGTSLPGDHTLYMKFYDFTHECQKWGKGGQYSPEDFPGWTPDASDCNLLSHALGSSETLEVAFDKPSGGAVTVTFSLDTTTGCNVSQAELTLHDYYDFNQTWHDGYDISLVNGFNYALTIGAPYKATTDPYTPGTPIRCLPTIQATSQLGNSQNPGVFGLGNDQCCASCRPPAECCSAWGDKIAAEAHPTYNNAAPNCPTTDPYAPCENDASKPERSGTSRCDARPRCQMDGWHSEAEGSTFTVTFGVSG